MANKEQGQRRMLANRKIAEELKAGKILTLQDLITFYEVEGLTKHSAESLPTGRFRTGKFEAETGVKPQRLIYERKSYWFAYPDEMDFEEKKERIIEELRKEI